MPRASLEFAATLYQEQNELLESMRDDNDSVLDAIYDAQKAMMIMFENYQLSQKS